MARVLPLACVLLLALGSQQPASANPLAIAKAVFEFGMEAYEDYQKIRAFLDRPPTADEELSATDVKMFGQLDEISTKITNMQHALLSKISQDLQDKLSVKLDIVFRHVRDVQRTYKTFVTYAENLDHIQNSTLARYVKMVTDNDLHKLSATVQEMHEALTATDAKYENVLTILSNKTNSDLMCIRNQSPQQIIYDLYKTMVITDAQSLIIKLFAYEKLEEWQNKKFNFEKNHEMKDFNRRMSNTYMHVKDAMSKASRELYKCDPIQHIKGKTYWKLQEIFQGYFMYERDFYDERCYRTCPTIGKEHDKCHTSFCLNKAEHKRCSGYLMNCQSVHGTMHVCNAKDSSDRKYSWMETGSGTIYGQKHSSCSMPLENRISHVGELFNNCEHCFCTCASESVNADRYFSLKDVTSDTLNNMVVTGVRFKVVNHVFHIQIQQGRLGANSSIDQDTVAWKQIANQVTDLQKFTKSVNERTEFKDNKYIYAVEPGRNTVYLDDIEPEPESPSVNEVITGLRFQQEGNDLKLEIQRTAFDYTTGALKSRSNWYSKDERKDLRKAVSLKQPIAPTAVNVNNDISGHNKYVEFQMTDLEKDLGQFTIPFIDMQNIESKPPVPMSGAGIFHRGGEGSGGFLALKLIEYDISKHM